MRTHIRSQEAKSEKIDIFKVLIFDLGQAGGRRAAIDVFVVIFLSVFEALGLCCLCQRPQALFFASVLRFSFSETLLLFSSKTASNDVPWASRAVHDLTRHKLVCAI